MKELKEFTVERLEEISSRALVSMDEASSLAKIALAAKQDEELNLPLDYLQGHKDGLEWAARTAEACNPLTSDWLYDEPEKLAAAIRKGPEMPPLNHTDHHLDMVVPAGWKLVPIEPTEDMVISGFESKPSQSFSPAIEWEEYEAMSGCQQAAHAAKLCWNAMLSAAPKPEM